MTLAHKVRDLTGPGHTDRFAIGGTDLGATAVAPDGRLVSVFGDTFAEATVGGPGWRSPVVLFAEPGAIGEGLRWTGSAGPGEHAGQVVRYRHFGPRRWGGRVRRVSTVLPTDIITIGDAMYLHVMVYQEPPKVVHWTEVHRSVDNGVTWHPTGARWPGDHLGGHFQILTWERDGGYVYAFSTGFQRDKGLVLSRVPEDRLLDVAAWETWGRTEDGWGWDRPYWPALPGRFGELSLRKVEDRWVLAMFDDGNYRMDIMVLRSPLDDLHVAPRATVLQGSEWDGEDHAAGRVAQLYGGFIVPGSTLADLHLVVSQWNTGTNWPYRAMQFAVDISALRG